MSAGFARLIVVAATLALALRAPAARKTDYEQHATLAYAPLGGEPGCLAQGLLSGPPARTASHAAALVLTQPGLADVRRDEMVAALCRKAAPCWRASLAQRRIAAGALPPTQRARRRLLSPLHASTAPGRSSCSASKNALGLRSISGPAPRSPRSGTARAVKRRSWPRHETRSPQARASHRAAAPPRREEPTNLTGA